ncbi:YopX family protein [Bacillus mycoides]|uniref:YopX family protein n=1 Tax=Bacillus mycoides TaxID=1405 RepID=UPI0036716C26
MREIKFRGRKINTNKWAVGNLGYTKTSSGNSGILVEGKLHIVDSETVGQYTGLKDAKGNEIYEGDILKFNTDSPGVVDYFRGSWRVKTPPKYSGDDWRTSLWDATVDGYEIIGNIYENQELLKGDEE